VSPIAINEEIAKIQHSLSVLEAEMKNISIELGVIKQSQVSQKEHSILLTRFDILTTEFKELCIDVRELKLHLHQIEMNTINKQDHQVLVNGIDSIRLKMAYYLGGFGVIMFIVEWYFRSH
jgi:hypothetical protein